MSVFRLLLNLFGFLLEPLYFCIYPLSTTCRTGIFPLYYLGSCTELVEVKIHSPTPFPLICGSCRLLYFQAVVRIRLSRIQRLLWG